MIKRADFCTLSMDFEFSSVSIECHVTASYSTSHLCYKDLQQASVLDFRISTKKEGKTDKTCKIFQYARWRGLGACGTLVHPQCRLPLQVRPSPSPSPLRNNILFHPHCDQLPPGPTAFLEILYAGETFIATKKKFSSPQMSNWRWQWQWQRHTQRKRHTQRQRHTKRQI